MLFTSWSSKVVVEFPNKNWGIFCAICKKIKKGNYQIDNQQYREGLCALYSYRIWIIPIVSQQHYSSSVDEQQVDDLDHPNWNL